MLGGGKKNLTNRPIRPHVIYGRPLTDVVVVIKINVLLYELTSLPILIVSPHMDYKIENKLFNNTRRVF